MCLFVRYQYDEILFHLVGDEKTMHSGMRNNMVFVVSSYLISILSTNQEKIVYLTPWNQPFIFLLIPKSRETIVQKIVVLHVILDIIS